MTAPIKPRRVDFWAGDWLGGTVALSLAERGLYITACALIYDAGGPIHKTDLRKAVGGRTDTFNSILLKLVDKGKLQLRDGMIDQVRCEREIAKARDRIVAKRQIGDGSVAKRAVLSPHVLNETNDLRTPYARAKAESQEKKKEDKILEGDRGVAALPSEPAPAPGPPTAEDKAYVDAAVDRAVAAVRGEVPKGIRDPARYKAAVTDAKFTSLVKNVNAWVGTALSGEAQWAAWEVLDAAEKAGARSGMTRAARRDFDRLVGMYRATGPPDEMAQAA